MGAQLTIKAALGTLDPENDAQWTAEGLPRMDVIEVLVGDKSITRKQVTEADPEFFREAARQRIVGAAMAESMAEVEAELKAKIEQERKDEIPEMQGRETQAEEINPEEALKATILALGEEIEEMTANRATIDGLLDVMRLQMAKLQMKAQTQHSAKADMLARMVFIKSQNEQRAGRFEKGRQIMALIGKDGMNPQCRLDMAMRRKTARGTKRPPPRTPKQ